MPFFLCGTAIAYQAFLKKPQIAAILYAASALFFAFHWLSIKIDEVPLAVSNLTLIAVVLTIVATKTFNWQLTWRPLARLGLVSYEFYLLHQNIGVTLINWVKASIDLPDLVVVAAVCSIMYGLAECLHYLSERIRRSLNVRYRGPRVRPLTA